MRRARVVAWWSVAAVLAVGVSVGWADWRDNFESYSAGTALSSPWTTTSGAVNVVSGGFTGQGIIRGGVDDGTVTQVIDSSVNEVTARFKLPFPNGASSGSQAWVTGVNFGVKNPDNGDYIVFEAFGYSWAWRKLKMLGTAFPTVTVDIEADTWYDLKLVRKSSAWKTYYKKSVDTSWIFLGSTAGTAFPNSTFEAKEVMVNLYHNFATGGGSDATTSGMVDDVAAATVTEPEPVYVPLWTDTFESYSIGALTSPWVAMPGASNAWDTTSGTINVGAVGYTGQGIFRGSTEGGQVGRAADSSISSLTARFKFPDYVGDAPSYQWCTGVDIGLGNAATGTFIQVEPFGYSRAWIRLKMCGTSFPNMSVDIEAGTWYDVRFAKDGLDWVVSYKKASDTEWLLLGSTEGTTFPRDTFQPEGSYVGMYKNYEGTDLTISCAVDDVATFYTPALLPGDANRDNKVDVSDLGILAANYGMTAGATWSLGDFNNDGKVDVSDLGILAANYGTGTGAALDFNKDAQALGLATGNDEAAKEAAGTTLGCGSMGFGLVAGMFLAGLLLSGLRMKE